ncbi:hypothetical protein DMA11_18655 [Marinilabiliaceae bacterium JC017]|nr:hypothetical protein DMA11_18655 [Marinilabiliaceae bacterium JC017]
MLLDLQLVYRQSNKSIIYKSVSDLKYRSSFQLPENRLQKPITDAQVSFQNRDKRKEIAFCRQSLLIFKI